MLGLQDRHTWSRTTWDEFYGGLIYGSSKLPPAQQTAQARMESSTLTENAMASLLMNLMQSNMQHHDLFWLYSLGCCVTMALLVLLLLLVMLPCSSSAVLCMPQHLGHPIGVQASIRRSHHPLEGQGCICCRQGAGGGIEQSEHRGPHDSGDQSQTSLTLQRSARFYSCSTATAVLHSTDLIAMMLCVCLVSAESCSGRRRLTVLRRTQQVLRNHLPPLAVHTIFWQAQQSAGDFQLQLCLSPGCMMLEVHVHHR